MIDDRLLEILVCPKDRKPLTLADPPLLSRLNRAIVAGRVKNRGGRTVEEPLQAALVRKDRALLYPIIDEIPVLLVDEGIALDQLDGDRGENP